MVTAMVAPTPTRTVVFTSDAEARKIRNAETATSGTRRAIDTMVTIVTTAVIRTILDQRDGETVSSSRRKRHTGQRASARPIIAPSASNPFRHDGRPRRPRLRFA